MNVTLLQHVPYEGPGALANWADMRHHKLEIVRLFSGENVPDFSKNIDLLVVLGGPMSVHDDALFNWLEPERNLIRACVTGRIPVLGICLGAQQLAAAMGDQVVRSPQTEIGWMPVTLTEQANSLTPFEKWPHEFMAFHWHGDMALPGKEATLLARSEGCPVQAFLYGSNAIGLQFHLEATEESVGSLIDNSLPLPPPSAFIQTPEQMRQLSKDFTERANRLLFSLLDHLIVSRSDQTTRP